VDYHKPGADLAKAMHAKLLAKPDVQVVLLKNHGVILGAETLLEIDRLLKVLDTRLGVEPRPVESSLAANSKLASALLDNTTYQICPDVTMHCLANDIELYKLLGDCWAICPDHVVFLGASSLRVDDPRNLSHVWQSVDQAPPFIFVKDMCVLENCNISSAQRAQLAFYLDVMLRQSVGQPLKSLSRNQIADLLTWDAEKYRQSQNLKTAI
jgi:rhamnose utilization protein RhaD (predicted bifunctional aldolase and dehydrogenase)